MKLMGGLVTRKTLNQSIFNENGQIDQQTNGRVVSGMWLKVKEYGKILVQPLTLLCLQFLDKDSNGRTIDCHWYYCFVIVIGLSGVCLLKHEWLT